MCIKWTAQSILNPGLFKKKKKSKRKKQMKAPPCLVYSVVGKPKTGCYIFFKLYRKYLFFHTKLVIIWSYRNVTSFAEKWLMPNLIAVPKNKASER